MCETYILQIEMGGTYEGERNTLQNWAVKQGEEGLLDDWQTKNMTSMDGLPTPIGWKFSVDRGE